MIGIDKCGGVKELRSLLYLGAMSYVGRQPEQPKLRRMLGRGASLIVLASRKPVLRWLTR